MEFKLPLFRQFCGQDEIPPTTPLESGVRSDAVLSFVLAGLDVEYSSISTSLFHNYMVIVTRCPVESVVLVLGVSMWESESAGRFAS